MSPRELSVQASPLFAENTDADRATEESDSMCVRQTRKGDIVTAAERRRLQRKYVDTAFGLR